MSDRTAWAICSSNGWWSVFGKPQRGKGKRPGPPVHDDLCAVLDEHGVTRHRFVASTVNELWLSDITEPSISIGPARGSCTCAPSRTSTRTASCTSTGYSIDSRMKSRIAVNALNSAVARSGDVAGCVLHTGRGSQFRSRKLVHALRGHDMVGSMGRVGAAGDNAAR